MATKIMVIRHAEKPNGLPGVLEDGSTRDDESLTSVGWARAKALVQLFDPAGGVFADRRLARPDKLFATVPNQKSQSLRPIETITPLARDLGKTIDERFGEGDEKELAVAAANASGVALVAWHHEKIPKLAKHILGSLDGVPQHWDDGRFDLVWTFDRAADGTWSFAQVPQLVMSGDSNLPIPLMQNDQGAARDSQTHST